jgi:hypothetical protein
VAKIKSDPEADPTTIEATLLWRKADRLVAMSQKGILYTWLIKPAEGPQEGDLVFVHYDKISGKVYSISPAGTT